MKILITCTLSTVFLVLSLAIKVNAQPDTLTCQNPKHWFIVLPLRFTWQQSEATMLSGVKMGRKLNGRWSAALSVYHSFYFDAFKAKAGIEGFTEQPRLFINGLGAEGEYCFYKRNNINTMAQLMIGWGFMDYQGQQHHFKAKQVNYFVFEPSVLAEYHIKESTAIGLGLGYRPVFTKKTITYTSDIGNGDILLDKNFPNGLNLLLTIKGLF
jgi:hypothetical protein